MSRRRGISVAFMNFHVFVFLLLVPTGLSLSLKGDNLQQQGGRGGRVRPRGPGRGGWQVIRNFIELEQEQQRKLGPQARYDLFSAAE